MGNLLRLLSRDTPKRDEIHHVFVDFENCQPTDDERPMWTRVEGVLSEGQTILLELTQYRGAAEEIRKAISNPKDEDLQEKAWHAVLPLVSQLKKYYEFSLKLENNVPILLEALCSKDKTPNQHLETQQALFKQFAVILDFVLKFDDLKMTNPVMQNDFSYYRRTQSRKRMANEFMKNSLRLKFAFKENANGEEDCVSNEMANRIALFYAHATPMLKMLSDTTARFVSQHKDLPVENTTDCLSAMANICRFMIEHEEYISRFNKEETKWFCLRVMVGVIILYDHVHFVGAFAKSSSIDEWFISKWKQNMNRRLHTVSVKVLLCNSPALIQPWRGLSGVLTAAVEMKSSIKLLKDQHPGRAEGLLNALRYTTKHLSDETTPKSVKALLAE